MNDKSLVIALFALLERENAVSIPQIATLLGSDEETIWGLLEELVFAYDAVQLRLELGDNHARLVRNETSKVLRLTQDETALLLDALEAHGLASNSELANKLIATKGFLGAAGTGNATDTDTQGVDNVGMPEPSIPSSIRTRSHGTQASVFETIAAACEDPEHHVVALDYHKEGAAKTEKRLVEPYAIRSDGDHSLLEAYDREREGWRTFRIDRIKGVEVLQECFEPKTPEERDTTTSALLLFMPGTLPEDWPDLKTVRTHEDGAIEARIPWYGSLWLPKKIIAHGKVQVQAPESLAQAVVSYARQLLQNQAQQ